MQTQPNNSRPGGAAGKDAFLYGALAGAALLIVCDQLIKGWAATALKAVREIRLIDGVLHLLYRENFGAAFSILQNRRLLLVGVTSAVMAGMLLALLLKKITHPLLISAFSLVLAGGVGNLIDRLRLGYVVDYIYFVPIDFPVFNLADCCVVVGTGLIVFYLLVVEPRQERRKKQAQGPAPEAPGNG